MLIPECPFAGYGGKHFPPLTWTPPSRITVPEISQNFRFVLLNMQLSSYPRPIYRLTAGHFALVSQVSRFSTDCTPTTFAARL